MTLLSPQERSNHQNTGRRNVGDRSIHNNSSNNDRDPSTAELGESRTTFSRGTSTPVTALKETQDHSETEVDCLDGFGFDDDGDLAGFGNVLDCGTDDSFVGGEWTDDEAVPHEEEHANDAEKLSGGGSSPRSTLIGADWQGSEPLSDDFTDCMLEDRERVICGVLQPGNYRSLSIEKVAALQEEDLVKASEILGLRQSSVRLLLRDQKWDVEQLLTSFIEEGKRAQLCSSAGVPFSENTTNATSACDSSSSSSSSSSSVGSNSADAEEMECSVCMDNILVSGAVSMECGHRFCRSCWKDHLDVKIKLDCQSGSHIRCLQRGCMLTVDEELVKKLVDHDTYQRYMRLLMRSYIDENHTLAHCPFPNCEHIVHIFSLGDLAVNVYCQDGHFFCFACHEDPHLPATCEMRSAWQKRRNQGSEDSTNWILSNTKQCPGCKRPTEKNGGCNHVTCSTCQTHWCWICVGIFDSQTVYRHSCNAFNDDNAWDNNTKAQQAKQLLERFTHYSDRYENHDRSKRFEKRLRKTTETKMIALSEKEEGHSWMDVRYLGECTDHLIRCREILKYSYVFAFYRFNPQGCHKELLGRGRPFASYSELQSAKLQFEFHQEELEGNTERLSRMLESSVDEITQQADYRVKVLDQTKLVMKKFHAMFGVVDRIYNEGATGSFENGTCYPPLPRKLQQASASASASASARAPARASARA
eukprot:CAMPEP_0174233826 /NCGR_PEP_ID=MMETSP0417-20130205/3761_1 /TAXON_ID=242541 /ORGANISM="Mayorella sp, Strain BSH-02190019" /LENGTH=701 /DNA_ID=CAMNT_0015312107 /DNA_START=369 /DNA_END=2470 /DNA_ORIENTATION=+